MNRPDKEQHLRLVTKVVDDSVFINITPTAYDVEDVVLGACIISKNVLISYADLLRDELFHKPENKIIFGCLKELYDAGDKVDMVTVYNQVRSRGNIDDIGGPGAISELTARISGGENTERHIRILQQYAMRRMIIDMAVDAAQCNYDDTKDVFDSIEEIEKSLVEIHEIIDSGRSQSMAEVVDDVLKQVNTAKEHKDKNMMIGLPTPYKRFNNETGGLQKTDMIVIAGRPGMGKTTFAINIADYISNLMNDSRPGVFFSLEMSAAQLVQKLLSKQSRVSTSSMRKGSISDGQINDLYSAGMKLKKVGKMIIDDTAAITPFQLKSKIRKLKAKYNIEWAAIDYLQLMRSPSKKNREQEIGHISGSIKEIAKECGIPIIAISQLSRAVEQRGGDKTPQLSDLRESGSIEQDADMVILLYRPEYYGLTEDAEGNSTTGKLRADIAKHRHGGTFDYWMKCALEYSLIENLEETGYSATPLPPNRDWMDELDD